MTLSTSDANALYKEMYGDSLSDVTIYDQNPFLASLKNSKLDTAIGGRGAYVPVRTAPPPCVSGNAPTGTVGFDRLVTNSTSLGSSVVSFLYTHAKLHGIVFLPTDQILQSDKSGKAFLDAVTLERDGITAHVSKQLEQILFDEGWGRIGRIASGQNLSSATITLQDVCDGTNFEKGMEIVAASAQSSAAIRAVSTNGAFVSAVTYTASNNTAQVVMGAAINDATDGISTAVAALDFLFVRNSKDPASSTTKHVPTGLGGHLPGTSTAHDTFFGVTRTANTRLKGLVLDGSGMPLLTAIRYADQIVYSNGGKLDIFWCSPRTFQRFQDEIVGKISYNEASVSKTAGVNFKAIELIGMSGNVLRIACSRGCSDRVMFGLTSNGWSYRTLHPGHVAVDDFDGNDWLRTASDGAQLRVSSRGQLVGTAHGHNIRIDLGEPQSI